MTTETLAPPTVFRSFILRTAQLTVDGLQSAPPMLPPDVRDQALHTLSFCFKLEDAWQLTRDILLNLAPKMELMGHRYDWIPYLEQGIEVSLHREDRRSAAEYQLQLGILYRKLSEFVAAQRYVQASIENFVLIRDHEGTVHSLNELAWIEHLVHRYDDAWQHAQDALKLLEGLTINKGMTYRVLGLICHDQNRFAEAESFHRHSLQWFQIEQDERKISWALQNLANSLRNQRRFDEAIIYYQQAAQTLFAMGDVYHWALVQLNLGTLYCNQEQPGEGLKYHIGGNQALLKFGDKLNIAKSNTGLGIAHLMLENYGEAEVAFQNSIALFAELGHENLRLNSVDGLAMTYLARQEYDKATQILIQALADLPRIQNASNYDYLVNSLANHLQAAKEGQRLCVT